MLETWELLSYVVTVVGLPMAILVYLLEKRQERINDEDDVYERLSRNYQDFLQLALDHPDLKLLSQTHTPNLTAEQEERMQAIFAMLIALFERAYLLLYEKEPERQGTSPLALLGRFHAGVVRARGLPQFFARSYSGRRPGVRGLHQRIGIQVLGLPVLSPQQEPNDARSAP